MSLEKRVKSSKAAMLLTNFFIIVSCGDWVLVRGMMESDVFGEGWVINLTNVCRTDQNSQKLATNQSRKKVL